MTRSQQIALLSVTLACAGAVLFPARTALAQDQAAIDKLVQMNKKALDDFDTLDFDAAKRKLLDALAAGKKAGLDNHPVMGRTYIHLGAVYITGFHDRQRGLQSFGRALEIDPSIQLSKGIESPEVSSAFAEAQRNARSGGASGGGGDESAPAPKKKHRGPIMEGDESAASEDRPPPKKKRKNPNEEPDLPAHINALDCPTPDEAIIDKPLVTRCAVAANLPVASVYLMYRAPDKEEFNEVLMTKTPKGWLQAKIPKKAVTGKSIQFYFEGRNAAGKPVVANGGAESPNIVLVVEEAAAGEAAKAAGGEEDENPLEENEGDQRPKIHLGRTDTSREGLDTRYGKRKWWIGIGVGSGYGFAKGNGFEAVNKSRETIPPGSQCSDTNPGFHCLQFQQGLAFAGLGHLVPEFGYALTPNMAVSLEGRLQYTGIPAKYSQFAAKGAIGVLAKLMFYTKQSQLRFFGTVIAGGGNYRFVGYPDAGSSNMYSDFKDTVAAGPVLLGVGGGLYYEASHTVSLVVEVHELAGLPLIGLVTDLNLSLQFNIYQAVVSGPKAYVPMGKDEEEPK
jgi:hypothetical protein